jgi:hypothetical protein
MAHDPGVHVYDVCRTSGRPLRQLVKTYRLTLRTAIDPGVAKVFGDFVLALYANTDMHSLMLCYTKVDLAKSFTVDMHVKLKGAHTIFARLHGCRMTDGAWAQEVLAAGCAQEFSTHGFLLTDIAEQPVARLWVDGFPFDPHAKVQVLPLRNVEADKLLTAVVQGHSRLTRYTPSTDNFPAVWVYLNQIRQLPIVWYAYHAIKMQTTSSNATRYFQRLLDVARKMALPGTTQPQLLADMLSVPSLAWVYRNDKDSRDKDGEYWASLWSNPPGHLTAFDCEDGAKALIELFHVFTGISLDDDASADLQYMKRLAEKYRAFFVIGELYQPPDGTPNPRQLSSRTGSKSNRSPSDYVMHCYGMLLPLRPEFLTPPITLDAAAYVSSAWSWPLLKAEEPSAASVEKQPLSCVRCSPHELAADGAYGALVSMFTCQKGQRTEHYLMNRVDVFDFLQKPVLPTPCYSLTYEATDAIFQEELARTPGSRFPTATSVSLPASLTHRTVLMPAALKKPKTVVWLSEEDSLHVV